MSPATSSTTVILPAPAGRSTRRAATLFIAAATLSLAVTGIGLFEGNVIYPSWYDLAAFDGFAEYHSSFGRRLLPWLPVPLLGATLLNGLLIRWRPPTVPRRVVVATFVLQIVVVTVTATVAIPLQADLGSPGHSPDEVLALLDRLVQVNRLREVPGVTVAAAFVWMLFRQVQTAQRLATGTGTGA